MCGILSTLNLELEIRLLEVPHRHTARILENKTLGKFRFLAKKGVIFIHKKITISAAILFKNTGRVCKQTKSVKYFNAIFPWV